MLSPIESKIEWGCLLWEPIELDPAPIQDFLKFEGFFEKWHQSVCCKFVQSRIILQGIKEPKMSRFSEQSQNSNVILVLGLGDFSNKPKIFLIEKYTIAYWKHHTSWLKGFGGKHCNALAAPNQLYLFQWKQPEKLDSLYQIYYLNLKFSYSNILHSIQNENYFQWLCMNMSFKH